MTDRTVLVELATIEAANMAGLVTQFTDLLNESGAGFAADPAVARLTPAAYADDEAAAEFRSEQQGLELWRHGRGGAPRVTSTSAVRISKWLSSRANRGVTTVAVAVGCGSAAFSVPRSSIRPMRGTLIASASRARSHAALTRAGRHCFTRPNMA